MPVGKQVFLLVIGPITTVMHGMTPAAATVKKVAFGRSKSPADAGKKKRPHSGHPRVDRSVLTTPIPASCKGKLFIQITLGSARRSFCHLERAGEGLLFELPPFEESRERFLVGWEELLVCPASSSNSEPKVIGAAQCVAER